MNHYDEQAWRNYLNASLSAAEIDAMEHHLYKCDECLAVYMDCLEMTSTTFPLLELETQGYVDAIIARTTGTKRSWYRSTILHYGIAAAATIILVATGFFHGLSQELNPSALQKKQEMPVSDVWLNKTLGWLDTLQNGSNKGGSHP
ncbi:hypothetical protein LOZ80_31630 [Paenibacillus sp. HWE-109]|uniref:hypothetical protein n=1 Tax=Paenibacillus sp. HWE-109 TaxID=1306526 RepID=UPI001EDE0C93|nr:hypothetical protein [Paenibacillus sp. HWE-109]UKS26055.1 hypothetical protein LOZ80_31630 [Paenibacillus sp. HWE-109]